MFMELNIYSTYERILWQFELSLTYINKHGCQWLHDKFTQVMKYHKELVNSLRPSDAYMRQ